MKRFQFNLEAVLTMRERAEQVAAKNWAEAVQAQAKAEKALADAKQELEDSHRMLDRTRGKTFHPGEASFYGAVAQTQKTICDDLTAALEEAVQFTKKQHMALLEARTKHEVLVRLKQKKMNEFECKARAAEEADVADLIIGRYGVRRVNS